jgi:Holliday junction resolvase RusA-like endonuclease
MKSLVFFADGTPVGQPRARACIRGRHAGVYDPGTADAWKRVVAIRAKEAWDKVQFDGPVKLTLSIWMPRPKKHFTSKGRKPFAPVWHTQKPDLDIIEKAIKDAITDAGVWKDDCLVCEVTKTKRFADLQSGAHIVIEEIETVKGA